MPDKAKTACFLYSNATLKFTNPANCFHYMVRFKVAAPPIPERGIAGRSQRILFCFPIALGAKGTSGTMVVTPQSRFGHSRRPPSPPCAPCPVRRDGRCYPMPSDSTGVTGHRGQYIYTYSTTEPAGGTWGRDSGVRGPPPQGMQAPHARWHEMCIARACARCDMGVRVPRG